MLNTECQIGVRLIVIKAPAISGLIGGKPTDHSSKICGADKSGRPT
jgi:hypothetical protein